MKSRLIALPVVFTLVLLCPAQSRSVRSQGMPKTMPGSRGLPVSSNEALALMTLRHLAEAEYTFMSTIGRGKDFGTLQELAAAQLIDVELAGGSKWGYGYKLSVTRATEAGPSSFEVIARPLEFGTAGIRSFHMAYLFRVTTDPGSPTEAPSFEVRAIPLQYGVTGR